VCDEKTGRESLISKAKNGWQGVQEEVIRRIQTRVWEPGSLLPNEVDIATEFGCARSTVNRALQAVADKGLIERKRKGGTRVVIHPEHKATFNIPIIRQQIEQQDLEYGYSLIKTRHAIPPAAVRDRLPDDVSEEILHIRAVHTADGLPYVLEDRWIDTRVVPSADEADFSAQSPNQWLLENIPYSGGTLRLSSENAKAADAKALSCDVGDALFIAERLTLTAERETITIVRLCYAPGYQMAIEL